ncbi:MAG: hypothetical protein MUF33_12460, partial [Candidatus Nanopelagicales bacterium]|nr:hypothetical protein [Candidatus Nanopelagicales bacterium]
MRKRTGIALLACFALMAVSPPAAQGNEAPSPSPTKPASGKLGTALAQLQTVTEGGGDADRWAQRAQLEVTSDEQVAVEVYVTGNVDAAAQKLTNAGLTVQATSAKPVPVVAG